MNILISHDWLKEYLATSASPQKIAECLSLCGASVESLNPQGSDWVYDIEVTTNRVDMMSVVGIARELAAILPQFGISAKLKKDQYSPKLQVPTPKFQAGKLSPLTVTIKDKALCPRFTAILLDTVAINQSPNKIKHRLKRSGIRPLNNVVDISNYLMREMGQPVHTFDYDRIKNHTMVMRKSNRGEIITTLDGKTHPLPGKDIVIEDGAKRLIDLCGIMGAQNSAIDSNTKRVLLFVQTYNPKYIRQTSMKLAHRTEAAQLFEKATDPELVMPTILYGSELMKKYAGAQVASKIYDIYPEPLQKKSLKVSLQFIEERLGVSLQPIKVSKILESLGFKVTFKLQTKSYQLIIPSWRTTDIDSGEDIVEEVARIYGYHNLPSNLPDGKLPRVPENQPFFWEEQVKQALKFWGYIETYTYSLQSEQLLKKFSLDPAQHLQLKNPLSKDWTLLRTSLLPSLLEVVTQNPQSDQLRLFELSKVYLPQKQGLPYEVQRLSSVGYDSFLQTKGLAEQLFRECNLEVSFEPHSQIAQLDPHQSAVIKAARNDLILGFIGTLYQPLARRFGLKNPITILDLNFDKLVQLATRGRAYKPLAKYPPVIEALTFANLPRILSTEIIRHIREVSTLVASVKVVDVYEDRLSFEIIYQSKKKSLSDKRVSKIRQAIVKKLEKLGLTLHGTLDT